MCGPSAGYAFQKGKMRRFPFLIVILFLGACGGPNRDVPPDCTEAVHVYARLCNRTTTNEDAAWQRLKHISCTSYESYEPQSEKQYEAFDKAVIWVDCVKAAATCEAADAC